MTKTTRTTSKKTAKTSAELVAWTATEAVPRPRWWLFVIVGYFGPVLAVIFLAAGNWSLSLASTIFTGLFFIVYAPKPKQWNYELEGDTLTATREHHRGRADELHLELANYREAVVGKKRTRSGERTVVTLLPSRRFGADVDIYLPDEKVVAAHIRRMIFLLFR